MTSINAETSQQSRYINLIVKIDHQGPTCVVGEPNICDREFKNTSHSLNLSHQIVFKFLKSSIQISLSEETSQNLDFLSPNTQIHLNEQK